MNALHKMQDYLQQTIVISQKTYNQQATSRTNGNAADEAKEATTQARDRQEEARHFYQQKNVKRPQKPRRSSTARSKTLLQNRSARETRQDGEHEDGVLGDHGGGLLQDAPRSPRSLNELAARLSKQNTTTRSTQCKPHSAERRNKHTREALRFVVFSFNMSYSEEWWFDVRPKGVGKKRPCPIDDLCSESSKSSSAPDATMARWYEAHETRVTASQSTHRSEWPSPLRKKASRERIQTFGCRPDVFRSNGSQLVHLWGLRSCQLSSSHNCRLSTVFSAN